MTADELTLTYETFDELLTAWARQVTQGALWVEGPVPTADELTIAIAVGSASFPGLRARLVRRAPLRGLAGYWLEVEATPAFSRAIEREARLRIAGRPAPPPPPGVTRAAERFAAGLEVEFENLQDLAQAYASDISQGGMFVRCVPQPPLGERVTVRLRLPDAEELRLEATVTQRVPGGTHPGVGVRFEAIAPESGARLDALLAEYRRRKPRVLIVDDEAIWRSTLSRAIKGLGAEVQVAADGHEGMLKLVDGFFELDLLILDLHMPQLDGQEVISRIRAHGGEWGLRIFLFSGLGADDLDALRRSGLANGVFSKTAPIDDLLERVASELALPAPKRKA